ncbi:putative reverse transcriptase domain-containing protein [Tanacetum coccineum]
MLTVELANRTVKYPKGIAENVLLGIGKFVFPVDFIILDMPKDVKVPLILRRPFLSIGHAKIDVFKIKIILRVGDDKIIFKSVKPASSLIKKVYMLILRERMELDLEARIMGETLVRDQVDDLIPTIEEGEVYEDAESTIDFDVVIAIGMLIYVRHLESSGRQRSEVQRYQAAGLGMLQLLMMQISETQGVGLDQYLKKHGSSKSLNA